MTRYSEGSFGKGGYGAAVISGPVGSSLIEKLPGIFPTHDNSEDFQTWIRAHQAEIDELQASIVQVQRSLRIAHAEGQSLDLIGSDFGQLGRRRGRDDGAYRQYLQSLVRAYGGRGTSEDIRFTVTSSLVISEDAISIVEDFQNNEYEIHLNEWPPHSAGTVSQMADIADPPSIPMVRQLYEQRGQMFLGGSEVPPGSPSLSSGLLGALSSSRWTLSS